MYIDIVKIGNSKGIRIPASILNSFENPTSVELEVREEGMLLKPKKENHVRAGWDEMFKANPDKEESIFSGIEHEFDEEEWTW